ncbi:MAG: archease [Dehalococcoidia bacterium]
MPADAARGRDFGYFAHDADTGIIGRGASVEEAFEGAARAMYEIMADTAAVRPERRIAVAFDEDDVEIALVRWLNGLLGEARAEGLILGDFRMRRDGSHWEGEGLGEPWRDDLVRRVEVKGATLTALSVRETDGVWEARCVVDV